MYVKYRHVPAYNGNPQRWIVEDVTLEEPSDVGENHEVYEVPTLFWIPNRTKYEDENIVLHNRIEVGSLGYPKAVYVFERNLVREFPGSEIETDTFRKRYLRNGEAYWDEESEIGKWLNAGGDLTVVMDGDDIKATSLFYYADGFAFSPRIWIHPDYRTWNDLYDHPVYEVAKNIISEDKANVVVGSVPDELMESWSDLFETYAGSDERFGFSKEKGVIWVADKEENAPDSAEVPTDWRDLVSISAIRRS